MLKTIKVQSVHFPKENKDCPPMFLDPWMASILAQFLIQIKEQPYWICFWAGNVFEMVAILDQKVTKVQKAPCWIQLTRLDVLDCFLTCCSPRWVGVADVVLLGPVCKHLFLSDEAMVWSPAPSLVLQVRYTLVWTSGFVIVIGHSFGLRVFPIGKTIQENIFYWFSILRLTFFIVFAFIESNSARPLFHKPWSKPISYEVNHIANFFDLTLRA